MADFVSSRGRSAELMVKAYKIIGDGDAINYGAPSPYGLAYLYASKVKMPGVDLPANAPWQVFETELMTREDYDLILEMGWPEFFKQFLTERIFDDAKEELLPANQTPVGIRSMWMKENVPVLSGGAVTTPMELLCGGRSLIPFMEDLLVLPDKVEQVMEKMVPHLSHEGIAYTRDGGYPSTWIMGCRSAPYMFSPEMWDHWVWPYFKYLTQKVTEADQIALLHLDSDWTRELPRFRELPAGRCIMSLDGETDIFAARKTLDGHMCIMGDVPSSMLYLAGPDDVFNYSRNLIKKLGPGGYILHSGCDIPANAKVENVRAMIRAAVES